MATDTGHQAVLDAREAGGGTRRFVRAALWVMAVSEAYVGGWAQFAPASFYAGFPLPGRNWVGMLPPYNEHLIRDVGGLSLVLVVVLVAAALRTDRWTVRVAAVAALVFMVPHTLFHALHLEHFPVGDAVVQTVGTVGLTLLAVVVLVVAGRLPEGRR
jgi:hypothetical protein